MEKHKKKYDTADRVYIPQPEVIEKYLKGKGLYNGVGKFIVSPKEIITMLFDLEAERKRIKAIEHYKQQDQKFKNENFQAVTDRLCIRYLAVEGIKKNQVTPEMIELKRSQILFERLRRQIKKVKDEKQNH